MDAEELAAALEDILDDLPTEDVLYGRVKRTSSFEAKGVLTTDAGLVVEMSDGTEFQVTVVKSA
jgi:hypothetical protein